MFTSCALVKDGDRTIVVMTDKAGRGWYMKSLADQKWSPLPPHPHVEEGESPFHIDPEDVHEPLVTETETRNPKAKGFLEQASKNK